LLRPISSFIATIRIHPCKANGDGKITGIAKRIVFEVRYNNPPLKWPSYALPDGFRHILDTMVVNYKDVKTFEPEPTDAYNTEYLVIAPTSLASGVQALVDWKKRCGYNTELLKISTTACPQASTTARCVRW